MNDQPLNLVGSEIAGRFRIVSLLGEGGAGQVYLAEHAVLDRRFAIKVLLEHARADQRMVERFRLEAQTASQLEHPNIVRITDFGRTDEGRLYLVMEYVDGQSLEALLETVRPDPLPLDRAIPILAQVCAAVAAAHEESIVHRDLKPDNVVLGRTVSGDEQVKVLDFGLAKIMQDVQAGGMNITGRGEIFGTPEYMAPEQARGEEVDHRADIYSLGAIAYDLLAGRPPIEHQDLHDQLRALQQELPEALSQVRPPHLPPLPVDIEVLVHRCLLKDPAQRPSTVASLVKLFDHYRAQLPRKRSPSLENLEVEALLRDTDPHGHRHDEEAPDVDPRSMEEAPSTLVSGAGPAPGTVDVKSWHWSQAVKKAEVLVARLQALQLAPDPLHAALGAQKEAAERVYAVETDLAVERAILDEPAEAESEAETRLRRAIFDLSIERDRLADTIPVDEQAVEDLDYQIHVLETNLGELYREETKRQSAQEDTVRELEKYASLCDQQLRSAEVELIRLAFQARPTPCPPDLAAVFAELASALRAFESVTLIEKKS